MGGWHLLYRVRWELLVLLTTYVSTLTAYPSSDYVSWSKLTTYALWLRIHLLTTSPLSMCLSTLTTYALWLRIHFSGGIHFLKANPLYKCLFPFWLPSHFLTAYPLGLPVHFDRVSTLTEYPLFWLRIQIDSVFILTAYHVLTAYPLFGSVSTFSAHPLFDCDSTLTAYPLFDCVYTFSTAYPLFQRISPLWLYIHSSTA